MGGYDHRPLAGVGGWLTFFLIGNGILSPLMVIAGLVGIYSDPTIAQAYGDTWLAIQVWSWLSTALTLALLAYLVWRVIKVHVWQTVRIVIALIWILAVGIPLLDMVLVALIANISIGDMIADGAGDLVRGPIYCLIWTAYFLRSERVANTFVRHAENELAEVFT